MKISLTLKVERGKPNPEGKGEAPQPEGSESMIIHDEQRPLGVRPIGFTREPDGQQS